MRKRTIPVLGAALTLLALGTVFSTSANATSPQVRAAAGHHAVKNVKIPLQGTACYNQMDNDQGNAGVSDKFSDQKTLNSKAADDFVLGANCTIDEVDVYGGTYGWPGPVESFTVRILKDTGNGTPDGHAVMTQKHLTNFTFTDGSGGAGLYGTYAITLNHPKALSGDTTYWLSVQAKMTLSTSGEWYWEGRTVQTGNPAQWKNPRDGFGTGCTQWCNEYNSIAVGPDHMFALVTNS